MMPDEEYGELPAKAGKPARRALKAAGYTEIEQFTHITEEELLELHGVGPKAIRAIGEALEERGLSFLAGK